MELYEFIRNHTNPYESILFHTQPANNSSFKSKKQPKTSLSMPLKKKQLSPPIDDPPPPGSVSVCLWRCLKQPTPRKKETRLRRTQGISDEAYYLQQNPKCKKGCQKAPQSEFVKKKNEIINIFRMILDADCWLWIRRVCLCRFLISRLGIHRMVLRRFVCHRF